MSASVLYDEPGPRARRISRILSVVLGVGFAALIGGGVYQLWLGGAFYADRWDIFQDPQYWIGQRGLLVGLRNTLTTAAIASVLAVIIGLLFALGRSARTRWVRIPVTIVLEFFRGMPVLLMILFVLLAFRFGPIEAVIAALAVYNGAIIGEAIRTGVAALPKGQRESGLAIGLSPLRTFALVELPQGVRIMLPVIIAQLVVLLKDTALGYIVSAPELITIGRDLAEFYGAGQYALSTTLVLLGIYLALNLSLTWIAHRVAKWSSKPRTKGKRIDGTPTTGIPVSTRAIREQRQQPGQNPSADITRLPDAGSGSSGGS